MSRIEELEKRLAADPNSRIFVQLAEAYRKEGLLDNAIEVCESGLAKHPEYPSARVALGRALLEAESFDRAREEFESVLDRVPDNILANKFLGDTYHRLGRYEDAIQKYEVAQTFAPDDAELGTRIENVRAEMSGAADETVTDDSLPEMSVPAPLDSVTETPLEEAEPFVEPPPVAAEPSPEWEAPVGEVLPPDGVFEMSGADEPEAVAPVDDEPAPIPLADVGDEPMILEDRAFTPPVQPTEPGPEPEPLVVPEEATPPVVGPDPIPVVEPDPVPVVEPDPVPVVEDAPQVEPISLIDPADPFEPPPEIAEEAEGTTGANPNDIETATVAELYAEQGHFDKAILVYRNLLAQEPERAQYLERIQELETQMNASVADGLEASPEPPGDSAPSDASRQRTIDALQRWLDAIQQSRRV